MMKRIEEGWFNGYLYCDNYTITLTKRSQLQHHFHFRSITLSFHASYSMYTQNTVCLLIIWMTLHLCNMHIIIFWSMYCIVYPTHSSYTFNSGSAYLFHRCNTIAHYICISLCPPPPPTPTPMYRQRPNSWTSLGLFTDTSTEYITLQEMKQGQCICPLRWSVHCNFTGYGKCNKRGWACNPHPHQPRLILPS